MVCKTKIFSKFWDDSLSQLQDFRRRQSLNGLCGPLLTSPDFLTGIQSPGSVKLLLRRWNTLADLFDALIVRHCHRANSSLALKLSGLFWLPCALGFKRYPGLNVASNLVYASCTISVFLNKYGMMFSRHAHRGNEIDSVESWVIYFDASTWYFT